jgi:hypothetical protein
MRGSIAFQHFVPGLPFMPCHGFPELMTREGTGLIFYLSE